MSDPDDGQTLPSRLNGAIDVAAGVIAGWLLAQGDDYTVLGLVILAFLAVNVFAPPRLQTRLHLAVAAVISTMVLVDVFIR
jgi:hypothetical protein